MEQRHLVMNRVCANNSLVRTVQGVEMEFVRSSSAVQRVDKSEDYGEKEG